jgi:hypothetical protein
MKSVGFYLFILFLKIFYVYVTPYMRINSKCNKDLNIRPEAVKLLETSIVEKLHDAGLDNDFLEVTPKAQVIKVNVHRQMVWY